MPEMLEGPELLAPRGQEAGSDEPYHCGRPEAEMPYLLAGDPVAEDAIHPIGSSKAPDAHREYGTVQHVQHNYPEMVLPTLC